MTIEKSNLIGTFNINGFNITLIHHEGTNVIGWDERYTVNSLSQFGTSMLSYKYFALALGKFNDEVTHAINMAVEDYRTNYIKNEWKQQS